MARTAGSVPAVVYASADEDLSAWELVNASQSDDEDLYSFDGDFVSTESDGVSSESDDVIEAEAEIKLDHDEEEESAGQPSDLVTQDEIEPIQALLDTPPTIYRFQTTVSHPYRDHGKRCYGCDDSDNDDEDDDDDDDDAAHDVDDELMPWKLKDKFGKQRMKKMGKRVGPKPSNSKKLPYYYHNRPSRLYGSNRKIEW